MVIPASWSNAYTRQKLLGDRLEEELKTHLSGVPASWYVSTRVKTRDSFYQKIETGNVPDFDNLEDFVGALVVVPLPSDIGVALDYLGGFFEVVERRPRSDTETTLAATDFRFDDIRLYGHLIVDDAMPPRVLDSILFEIQIKTFFQHAWATATHDLVYKYPTFSWSRSRLAAQVKAILEQAEMSISSIDMLEKSSVLSRVGEPERSWNRFLDVLLKHWDEEYLPSNRKRTVESIAVLCQAVGMDASGADELLMRGVAELGAHPDGWSPYQCIVDYLSRFRSKELTRLLRRSPRRPKVVHVTQEVLDRLGLSIGECPTARL